MAEIGHTYEVYTKVPSSREEVFRPWSFTFLICRNVIQTGFSDNWPEQGPPFLGLFQGHTDFLHGGGGVMRLLSLSLFVSLSNSCVLTFYFPLFPTFSSFPSIFVALTIIYLCCSLSLYISSISVTLSLSSFSPSFLYKSSKQKTFQTNHITEKQSILINIKQRVPYIENWTQHIEQVV